MTLRRQPSTGEWSVLGLLGEEPAHGWALAAALSREGEIGAIWTLSKPLVYRALDVLEEAGLIEQAGPASSARGPNRTIFRPTREGRGAFARWLQEPVRHIRDLRPDLLLKLVFLRRAGGDTAALLDAQEALVAELLHDLESELESATGEQALLMRYRLEIARAALRFIAAEHAATSRSRVSSRDRAPRARGRARG
jgi:DNA-binding PadR family transcriptional regulator